MRAVEIAAINRARIAIKLAIDHMDRAKRGSRDGRTKRLIDTAMDRLNEALEELDPR